MSKGDKQRPGTGYADNWDRIFKQEAPEDPFKFDLLWHALNYRCAMLPGDATVAFESLSACVNRLIERGEKV